jgi:hypothetical protein
MKNSFLTALLVVCAGVLLTSSLHAQERQTKRLSIPTGKTSVSATGSITGYQDIDYIVNAAAGQTMTVKMKSNINSNYFLVYGPGNTETALYNSDAGEQTWTTTLTQSGDHTIRVYLMRSAARNNVKANFTVTVTVKGSAATKPGDALVPGTKFNATSIIDAALTPDVAIGSTKADVGVIRYANGDAELHITNAKKQQRIFRYSKATGKFTCTFPEGWKLETTKSGEYDWIVSVNDQEYYKIPEAVIVGG